MANTFTLIDSITVGSGGTSSLTFSSIPSTYTDLCVKISTRNMDGTVLSYVRINGDTGSNYSNRRLYATGSAVASNSSSGTFFTLYGGGDASSYTANTFSNAEIYIPNYANTSYIKPISFDGTTENNATESYLSFDAGVWNSTSAINSISIFYSGINQAQYSTAYLYGIKNS
jgi:hypothetical protein